jgi:hypothetical protein
MVTRRMYLFEGEREQSLLEELTAWQFDLGEVIVAECGDNESDDVQFAAASGAPSALSAIFMWEDMTNYVGQREQFVDNYGPQNETQNETHCAKVIKMFLMTNWLY